MSNDDSGPAPKLDPEDGVLRARPRPVRRINRRVLFLLAGTGLILTFGAVIVALDPPNLFDRTETGRKLYRTENNPTPEGLEQLPSRYSDLEPKVELGPPLTGDIGPAMVETERDLGIAPSDNLPFRPDRKPSVRVVLGHFIFVYIHPYMDGNGRMGRFLMNVMLASGGYPWTVIPVERRNDYMAALDSDNDGAHIARRGFPIDLPMVGYGADRH